MTNDTNDTTNIVFIKNGRLGNAFFRYIACSLFSIKYKLNFQIENNDIQKEMKNPTSFFFIKGKDHMLDDITHINLNVDLYELQKYLIEDKNVVCFNTLGFIKNKINFQKLCSNHYINEENNQGLFVKKYIHINEDDFFYYLNSFTPSVIFNDLGTITSHLVLEKYYQFDYIFLKYKKEILQYIQRNPFHELEEAYTEKKFPIEIFTKTIDLKEKKYDIVIHIRLDDFFGRSDFIEVEYYEKLFDSIKEQFQKNMKTSIVIGKINQTYEIEFMNRINQWFSKNNISITIEQNDVMTDFYIMKQATTLVCSMSTFSWMSAYLSDTLKTCYMPNYNFYNHPEPERKYNYFKKPIENTILYEVKTTQFQKIKVIILTLEKYPERLESLTEFICKLSQIGLQYEIIYGINGESIQTTNTENPNIQILSIDKEKKTYPYDKTKRLNGQPMKKGEFGCAWSHLNIYEKLINDSCFDEYLIFEDDVSLTSSLDTLYDTLLNLPKQYDVCHISLSDWYPFIKTEKINNYFYRPYKRFFNRLTAYVVSKRGAQKLTHYSNGFINYPADDLLSEIYLKTNDFDLYVPETYLFQERENNHSIIGIVNDSIPLNVTDSYLNT